jgi:NAD(P)-dependent dehydrogenase (short-subunit alcohol dehydrogenase family)
VGSDRPGREELLLQDWTGVAGKRVVITGATNGIGLAGAQELAARGAQLTLVARNEDRAAPAIARISARAREDASVDVLICDLSLQESVRALAAQLLERYPRIDVLVNNAGAMYRGAPLSGDGIELTWALNHLAPFLLTELLLGRMIASAPARIVTTSSDAHRGRRLTLEHVGAAPGARSSRGFRRYGETKLANILFTGELARRLEGTGVSANCFHPGLVASGFNRNNGPLARAAMTVLQPLSRSPEEGARTLVWLVDSDEAGAISGGYFADERLATPSAEATDAATAEALWRLSLAQVGL